MDTKMTVKEWVAAYKNGEMEKEEAMVDKAGWYDWFCSNAGLVGRTKRISKIPRRITNEYLLNNFYIWLKNNCPCTGPLYDKIGFEHITPDGKRDGQFFVISCDDKRDDKRYVLYTEKADYKEEYATDNLKELMNYIDNVLGPELEKMQKDKENKQ